jgi:hypothetical protein
MRRVVVLAEACSELAGACDDLDRERPGYGLLFAEAIQREFAPDRDAAVRRKIAG